ncbi:MAG: hypothetical protein LBI86_12210 [Treponema sp.]|jgi:class 3 adenylate cyclase|nr:hypothetical protein [Treponema sp.]
MSAFITPKKYLLILFIALVSAALTAFLLEYVLRGPRLGFYYDFLAGRRPAAVLPREILLIDTEDIAESGTVVSVLDALIEFDADSLVLEVPVLGFSPVEEGDEDQMRRRLDEEFVLLGRNIRNLFEAIRTGSVAPRDADRYVGELVDLAERGKERLGAALIDRDTSSVQLEKEAGAFGALFRTGDLRPRPDRDGVLRRVVPVFPDGAEHAVYAALKKKWSGASSGAVSSGFSPANSGLEYTEYGPVLAGGNRSGEEVIPLDRDGAVLIEQSTGYRRLPLSAFIRYRDADRSLRGLLGEAEGLGIYSAGAPENSPLYLYDYSEALREDMLASPSAETRGAWKASRAGYVKSLEELLSGPSEAVLVGGYEELIVTENLDDRGISRLMGLRDELTEAFQKLRNACNTFTTLRLDMEADLESSLCIMGSNPEPSARLALALISGRSVVPGRRIHVLFWSLCAAFLAITGASRFCQAVCLAAAPVLGALLAFVFSWYFVFSGYWIDPLVPSASACAGILVFWTGSLIVAVRGASSFRRAYGNAAGKPWLKQLIRKGRPLPPERIRARTAVMAVKDPALLAAEDQGDPAGAALALEKFREEASTVLKKAGAVILGYERDMVVACFGSPLERVCLGRLKGETPYSDDPGAGGGHPAVKAAGFVTELFRLRPGLSWRFGMDYGECLFHWSAMSGYTACGSPAVRSRVLAGLTGRYHSRVLVTEPVRELLSLPVRKLHSLASVREDGGTVKTYFYELPVAARSEA